MSHPPNLAQAVFDHCRRIAAFTDQPGTITRSFLGPAMRACLSYFTAWAGSFGMRQVRVDQAGNFRAILPGRFSHRLIIGSHLDSVPNAGAYDGLLGVVLGMTIAESFQQERPGCTLEIIGFSEEEGVRFGRPFIGSVALAQGLDDTFLTLKDQAGITVRQAIENFGLDTAHLNQPQMEPASGYLEFHIEQGPILENLGLPLGVVETIAGQSRALVRFIGKANHAGTTPMNLRQDAMCAAAEWVLAVERKALDTSGLVGTVGSLNLTPGAANSIPGQATVSLDLRHAADSIRTEALEELLREGHEIAAARHLHFESNIALDQAAVPMDAALVRNVERALAAAGVQPHRMTSGAGHDAMILAKRIPSAMIFLRSPGGISHHPDETVFLEDIELALLAGKSFVENFV